MSGIEPGRAGMLAEFAGLSTPLVADACIRRKVPLRVAAVRQAQAPHRGQAARLEQLRRGRRAQPAPAPHG